MADREGGAIYLNMNNRNTPKTTINDCKFNNNMANNANDNTDGSSSLYIITKTSNQFVEVSNCEFINCQPQKNANIFKKLQHQF